MDTGDRLPFEFLRALDILERDGLPKEMTGFNMNMFGNIHLLDTRINFEGSAVCGTVGCFAGVLSYLIPKRKTETWIKYSSRISGLNDNEGAWSWLFSGFWPPVDNTLQGAINRARYYNFYGLPDNWKGQLSGNAPLSYEKVSIEVPVS